jgi:hypothetical protein
MAVGGGATEEDFFCTEDMGLSREDVADIHGNWSQTIEQGSNGDSSTHSTRL